MEPLGFERFCFQTEEGDWIECPIFEGKNPKFWVVSIKNFLNRFGIPTEQHVNFSSHQICGDAYRWVEVNRDVIAWWSWSQFVNALCVQFDTDKYIEENVVDLEVSIVKETDSMEDESKLVEEQDCQVDSSLVSVVSDSFKDDEIDALIEKTVAVIDEQLPSTKVDINNSMVKNGLMSPYKAMSCSQYGQGNYPCQLFDRMPQRDASYFAATEWWKSHVSAFVGDVIEFYSWRVMVLKKACRFFLDLPFYGFFHSPFHEDIVTLSTLIIKHMVLQDTNVFRRVMGVNYLSLVVLTPLYTNPHGLHLFSKDGRILRFISSASWKNVSSQMFEKSGTQLLCGAMNGLVLVLDIVLTTPFDWLVRQISLKPMKCYLVTHLLWIRCTGCPYCACVWPLSGILLHQKDKSVVCISYVTIDAALQLLVPVQKECDQSGTVNFSISYCCLNTMERGSLRYTIYISNTLLVCSSFSMCRCSSFVQKDDNKPAKEGLEQNCGEFQYFSGVVFCSARVYIARNIHNRTHEDIRGQILLLELLHMLLSRLVIRHFMSHMPMYSIVEIRAAIIQVFELVSSQVRINNLRFIASIHYHSTVHQLEALEYIIIQVSSTELQGSFGGKEGLAAVQQYWYFAVILPMWCLDTGEQACIWNIITTFPAELCYGQLWQHTSNTNVVLNDLAVQLGISAMPLLVKGSCYPLTVAAISCGIKKRSRMIPISILLVSREKEGACFHLGGGTLDVFHGPLEEVNEALLGLLLELHISVTSHLRAQDVAKDSVPSTTPATVISMVESRNKPTTYSDMTCYVFFDVVIFKGGSYTRKNVQQNLAWLMHNSGQRDLCILKLTGYKEFSYSGKLGRLYYAMHLYIGWAWSLHQVQYFSSLVIRTWVLFLWVIAWGTLGIFWCHSVSLCMVEDRIADDTRVMTDEYFVHKVVLLGGYRRCSKVQQFRQNHLIGPGTSKLIKAKEVINQGSTVVGVLVSEEEGLKCDADGRRSEDARQAMHVGKSKLPSLSMLSRPGYCHDPSPMSISSMRTWIFSSTRHCHEPNHDPAQE